MALPGTNPAYQYLDEGMPDGAILGVTITSKVGFFGLTPVIQPLATNQAAIISYASVSISATQFGYTTSTQATGIVNLLLQLRSDLVALGLIKGSQ